MLNISVIIGSTRPNRFSEIPAGWIFEHLKKREGVNARMLDLRDYPMPFFDQPESPANPTRPPFENEDVQRWTAEIAASDGFIFVTPEYNYAPSAVLKNAIDWVYREWHRKAAAYVSYGLLGGSRSIQQLREMSVELQMVSARNLVAVPKEVLIVRMQGGDPVPELAKFDRDANNMIDELMWWTRALKEARSQSNIKASLP